MSFSYYGELCTEVYDLTKPVGYSLNGDLDYYRERLAPVKGRILEAMAGSGRVLIPLVEAGLQVDGVDASPEMLESCRRRCRERGLSPGLYEMNLQELALPHRYEAIFVASGSFLLLENREESLDVLKRFYDHLEPGGRLILDIFLPGISNLDVSGRTGVSTFTLPDGDTITMESKLVDADIPGQTNATHLKYEKWRGGQLLQTELQRLVLRWYGIEEFKLVLEKIGFCDIEVSADFQYGKKPVRGSKVYVFEAVKQG